jgi:hypothetical protein
VINEISLGGPAAEKLEAARPPWMNVGIHDIAVQMS